MRHFMAKLGISLTVACSTAAFSACPHSLLAGDWHGTWVNQTGQTSGQIEQAALTTCHTLRVTYEDSKQRSRQLRMRVERANGGVNLSNRVHHLVLFAWKVSGGHIAMLGFVGQGGQQQQLVASLQH